MDEYPNYAKAGNWLMKITPEFGGYGLHGRDMLTIVELPIDGKQDYSDLVFSRVGDKWLFTDLAGTLNGRNITGLRDESSAIFREATKFLDENRPGGM